MWKWYFDTRNHNTSKGSLSANFLKIRDPSSLSLSTQSQWLSLASLPVWHQRSFNLFRRKSVLNVRVAEADACLCDCQNLCCLASNPNVTAGRAVSIDLSWSVLKFAVSSRTGEAGLVEKILYFFLEFLSTKWVWLHPFPQKVCLVSETDILHTKFRVCRSTPSWNVLYKREKSFFSYTKKWIQSDVSILSSRTIPPPQPTRHPSNERAPRGGVVSFAEFWDLAGACWFWATPWTWGSTTASGTTCSWTQPVRVLGSGFQVWRFLEFTDGGLVAVLYSGFHI